MTILRMRIASILKKDLAQSGDKRSKAKVIEALIPAWGWPTVLQEMSLLLRDSESAEDWRIAAEVLWSAARDGRPMPADRIVALLCKRWPPGEREDTLAWNIISKLKGTDASSSSPYDPLQDAGVCAELDTLGGMEVAHVDSRLTAPESTR